MIQLSHQLFTLRQVSKTEQNRKQGYCSATFYITPFYTSPRRIYSIPAALRVREELVWFFSYPLAMPRSCFSLSKYTEQRKCKLKLRNPPGGPRHGAISLLHSSCPLRTVTQTDRQRRKAGGAKTHRKTWSVITVPRLMPLSTGKLRPGSQSYLYQAPASPHLHRQSVWQGIQKATAERRMATAACSHLGFQMRTWEPCMNYRHESQHSVWSYVGLFVNTF